LYINSEGPLRDVANALTVVTALTACYLAFTHGRVSLSGFVLIVVVTRQATIPLGHIGGALVQLHAVVGASQRLREILAKDPQTGGGTLEAPALQSGIRFENVDFEYVPSLPVLREINLELRRGTTTAIVGASGVGKSTLTDLLLRLQEPIAGTLFYDGVDVRLFTQASYRQRFGVVSQDPLLFNASVEANVAYGRRVDPGRVAEVLRLANAAEFVTALPEGTATLVGDRGVKLSGGQRQRIAIARALYGQPDVLVFDEATSFLDSHSERLVQAGIERALLGRTAMIIAHRLSTVVRADQIVVLAEGRVVRVGRHADLIASDESYRKLVLDQLAAVHLAEGEQSG
jgi:ABC-type multidrug transport system fused ATPase/permease subunit